MAEATIERVHKEKAVLDIGGDVGALIIYTDEGRVGDEIELSPRGQPSRRTHNQVHERALNGRSVSAAIFPALRAGTYQIWKNDTEVAGETTIAGGSVASIDWRGTELGQPQHHHFPYDHDHPHPHVHDHNGGHSH